MRIFFRFVAASGTANASKERIKTQSTKTKILLADDDEEILAALSVALESEGYEVVPARNGREAIEHFWDDRFDIALLDLNMPLKGGWEVLARLRVVHPLLQVIVITARPDQYSLAAALGVAALIEKPFELDRLFQLIDELMSEPVEERLMRYHRKRLSTRYVKAEYD